MKLNKHNQNYYCKCGKEIHYNTALYGLGMCRLCSDKIRFKKAKKYQNYYCKECKNKICYQNALYGSGLCRSCAKQKLDSNPIYVRNMSIAIKKSHARPEIKAKLVKANKGKKLTRETRKKISLGLGGTGVPYENYDLTYAIRLLSEYREWRTKVFKRDNFKCQECGKVGYHLEVHHIKRFAKVLKEFLNKYNKLSPIEDKATLLNLAIKYKPFWKISNGKTLCKDCHKLTDNYKNNTVKLEVAYM